MCASKICVRSGLEIASEKTILWRIEAFDVIVTHPELIKSLEFEFEIEDEDKELSRTAWKLFLKVITPWPNSPSIQLCYTPMDLPTDPDKHPLLISRFGLVGPSKTIMHKAIASMLDKEGRKCKTSEGPGAVHKIFDHSGRVKDDKVCCIMEFPMTAENLPLVDCRLVLEVTLQFYKHRKIEKHFIDGSFDQCQQNAKKRYLNLLFSGELSDAKIYSRDGEQFKVHKTVLRARSEVFDKLFKTGMKEAVTGVIRLNDISSNAVKFLLHFAYGCNILPVNYDEDKNGSDSQEEAKEVNVKEALHVASKYGFKDLQNWLDQDIPNHLNEKNAWFLYGLCKTYSLKSLDAVKEFISQCPSLLKMLVDRMQI